MNWKLDQAGLGFTAAHEAIYLYVYPDPGTGREPWTGGIGHTAAAGGWKPRPGERITLRQALDIFKIDMVKYERGVIAAVGPYVKKQTQFNGLVSFHFNTGAINTGTVDNKIRAGDWSGAMRVLNMYRNAGGKVMKGLVTRRREETQLIMNGVYPNRKILLKERPGVKGRYVDVRSLPWEQKQLKIDPEIFNDDSIVNVDVIDIGENFIWELLKTLWRWLNK